MPPTLPRPFKVTIGMAMLAAPLLATSNVVFMMADDLGWNDVGYHGSEIRTPHIDSIAQRGIQLNRYYASPLCSPTRAALLTGRIPLRFGVDRPIETIGGLPETERLLTDVLKTAGYGTALVGKWHLGLAHIKYHPYSRGFDTSYGHLGPAVDYWTHIWDGGLDWHRNGKVLNEEGYTTELIGKAAERVISDRDKAKPLFLYVAFNAPHGPLQAPPESVSAYDSIQNPRRRTYAAMVSEMDRAVGGILGTLQEEGLTDDTLIVWCSDNGGAVRLGADNSPLRGGKGGAFEGGIRVPAAVWKPGSIEGGQTFTQMMTVADWFPTIAAATGIDLDAGAELDGVDMWSALTTGENVQRSEPYVVGVFDSVALIDGMWKYVEPLPRGGSGVAHLFRLDQDPEEREDLAEVEPERFEAMRQQLHSFPRTATIAPDVTPPPGPRRGRPGGRPPPNAGGEGARTPPGRGGGAVDGWKEITKPPWVEAADR